MKEIVIRIRLRDEGWRLRDFHGTGKPIAECIVAHVAALLVNAGADADVELVDVVDTPIIKNFPP